MAGSSNILQWDAPGTNMSSDVNYAADSQRINGAPSGVGGGVVFPSTTANKLFYQVTTFCSALAKALANKGYVISDADYNTLVGVLANVKTSADFLQAVQVVPYASSLTFDAAVSASYDLTLTGNVTSSTLVNVTDGQLLLFTISQDSTGGRTFSPPPTINDFGAICSLANSTSIQLFLVRPSAVTSGVTRIIPITDMLWVTPNGLRIGGGVGIVPVSVSGTVSSAYREIVELVNASGGPITRTFFNPSGYAGYKINIKKIDGTNNTVTAAAPGGSQIDGLVSSYPISQQSVSLTFVCDGANFWII